MIDMKQLITIADTNPYYPAGILPQEMKVLLSHDFSALQDISWKSAVTGKSPRALAIIGNKAYTAGYFADKVEIFDLDPAGYVADTVKISNPGSDSAAAASGVIPLGPDPAQTSERKGECAFYDAGLSFQKWESCNTCHPLTRSDGIGWTLRGEYAAPKKSKSMLNSWWTPPTNWAGTRANAWESIRAGMNNELFLDPDMTIAAYMDTLLMKLKPVSSPYLVKGRLSASAARGREIFRGSKAACFACHSGPLYTDTKFHASIIPDQYDANAKWDTPSLVECWRTAPYGHLGSMSTIQEMLGLSGMGDVSAKLTQDELNDLAEFVLSL
jgi:cytochrome c peroxidase